MIKECLIIDDDEEDHEIFSICLKAVSQNIRCVMIGDSVEAIKMLGSNTEYTPHYILIDVNMPKMNGIECLRILKTMDRLADTKMYMYSTSIERGILKESQKLGAVEYIIKPAKIAELKAKLSEIFEIVPE